MCEHLLLGEISEHELALLRRDEVDHPVIYVGAGTCGLGAGAGQTLERIHTWLEEHPEHQAEVVRVGCVGLCSHEPLVDVQLPGRPRVTYGGMDAEHVVDLLDAALVLGDCASEMVQERAVGQAGQGEPWDLPLLAEHPFFAPQERRVLARCGAEDPVNLRAAMAWGAFGALASVLQEKSPAEVCAEVERAGLRGRGGGGFSTGTKWRFALGQEAPDRVLVCNADEGDPGAFMDRAVIEGDPYRLLEGMAIAAYAIGASRAFVYIRAEYPQAIEHLRTAISRAREHGLLGTDILGSGFDLDIAIRVGAGAFVCGEETALLRSLEGKRGMPVPRPPYPTTSGFEGLPTVINNVETLANVPGILAHGAEWFAGLGTETSKGTKVFALSGHVERTGLVEVAMGTTVRQIVFDVGGGIPHGRAYKAVQIGGPSGGCIPESHLDIDVDYESLKTVGAMMGSGGLVVMDETTCMVDVAHFFMDFIQKESCGKCIPCREGTRRMLEILTSLKRPRRSEQGIDALVRFKGIMALEDLAEVIQQTSLCGLGQSAPNPVLSTLRWFRDEYEAHVFERRCPAHACRDLLTYRILEDACRGCTLCARKCPTGAILGRKRAPHYIVPDKCIGCGQCAEICKFDAVEVL